MRMTMTYPDVDVDVDVDADAGGGKDDGGPGRPSHVTSYTPPRPGPEHPALSCSLSDNVSLVEISYMYI